MFRCSFGAFFVGNRTTILLNCTKNTKTASDMVRCCVCLVQFNNIMVQFPTKMHRNCTKNCTTKRCSLCANAPKMHRKLHHQSCILVDFMCGDFVQTFSFFTKLGAVKPPFANPRNLQGTVPNTVKQLSMILL